jgi:3-oxoacyl-[acyl-carrier protein] reductase
MSNGEELAGAVALISGASGGIGSAVASALREAGATAVGYDLRRPTDDADAIAGDVGDDRAVERAVARVDELHGRLDILVHAAGITRDAVLWKLAPEDWDRVHRVNLRGAFLLMRHAVPLMRRGRRGRVVLVGSVNGSRGRFGQTAYAASKAGLLGLAKSAARETARFGIRVNVIEPGMTRTPMTERMSEEHRRAAVDEGLLGKMAEPEEIAAAVLFLCGPGSTHITGQILRVDGGEYI